MAATQDNAYKALFSHPELMRDLLRHFVHEAWVDTIDFDSFEKVGSNLVSSELRNRDSDLIWRFRLSGQWLYVYLLLEFQSRDDYWMAQRVAVYRHLLYEDLRRNGAVKARGLLPRVCPVVLYTGRGRWRASRDMADLLAPAPPGLSTLGQVFTSWINLIVANRGGMGENFIPFKDLSEVAGMGNVAETWAHRWERKGVRKGRVELLERQLVHRYRGPLPDWARRRLRTANVAQLDAWAEAIFEAPTLEALLGGE